MEYIQKYRKFIIAAVALLVIFLLLGTFIWTALNRTLSGTVQITTNMDSVDINIDGTDKGAAPLKLTLRSGKHKITATKKGYERKSQDINLHGGETRNIFFELSLPNLSQEDFGNLSEKEKAEYERLSDSQTDQDEAFLRKQNPLVGSLPYTDADLRFRVDYGGSINEASYLITLYGYNDTEFNQNKTAALEWIKSESQDPDSLKISYKKQLLGGSPGQSPNE